MCNSEREERRGERERERERDFVGNLCFLLFFFLFLSFFSFFPCSFISVSEIRRYPEILQNNSKWVYNPKTKKNLGLGLR